MALPGTFSLTQWVRGRREGAAINSAWTWVRRLGAAALLTGLLVRAGTGPLRAAAHALSVPLLLVAMGGIVVTTVCCAWRWRLVSECLGQPMRLRSAVGAYYRSQFLNLTLPGGVLGDVERGVRHGRIAGAVPRGLRTVAWERVIGQVVQIVVSAAVLALWPSPLRTPILLAAGVVAAVLAGVAGVFVGLSRTRLVRSLLRDVWCLCRAPRAWAGLVLTSFVAAGVYAGLFLVAARAVDVPVPTMRLVPLAFAVMVASAVPANIAGWGAREGAAAAVFAMAGASAAQGLSVSVLYGLMVFAATTPGALLLFVVRRRPPAGWKPEARRVAGSLERSRA